MSISSIGASFIASASKVSSSSTNSVAAAAQEATETQTDTLKEAQHGDPIAKKKLAQLQARHDAAASKASEPGKGTEVDHTA